MPHAASGTAHEEAGPARAGPAVLLLVALMSAPFLIGVDFTAVTVTLTDMERDLDSDLSTIQWVVNAYLLTLGMAMITAGRLSDVLGRRRLLVGGIVVFASASLLGALALTDWWLIGARGIQGLGGAALWTATLGTVYSIMPPERRAFGVALMLAVAGSANAVGPLIGGALTDLVSWRLVLAVNVPTAALALAIILRRVEAAPGSGVAKTDYAGIGTLSAAVVAVLVALDQASTWGFASPGFVGLCAAAVVLLAVFVAIEHRVGEDALVPPTVMRTLAMRASCVAIGLLTPLLFATLVYMPQYFQKVKDFSVLESGLAFAPMFVVFAVLSPLSGNIYDRIGPRALVAVGGLAMTLGGIALALLDAGSPYAAALPGLGLMGLGFALGLSAASTAAVDSVTEAKASLAGGISYMVQLTVGGIGVAIATVVTVTVGEDRIESDLEAAGVSVSAEELHRIDGTLAGTEAAADALARLSASTAARAHEAVREAFTAGMTTALLVLACVSAIGTLYAFLRLPRSAVDRSEAAAESRSE